MLWTDCQRAVGEQSTRVSELSTGVTDGCELSTGCQWAVNGLPTVDGLSTGSFCIGAIVRSGRRGYKCDVCDVGNGAALITHQECLVRTGVGGARKCDFVKDFALPGPSKLEFSRRFAPDLKRGCWKLLGEGGNRIPKKCCQVLGNSMRLPEICSDLATMYDFRSHYHINTIPLRHLH